MSIALGVLRTVDRTITRDGRLSTARGNAWAAICADRERARQRDEVRRAVIALGRTAGARPAEVRRSGVRAAGARTAGVRTAGAQSGR